MKLPNPDRAVIEPAKLRDYLLSAAHPVGRFKAVFFSALGFSQENWTELETALRTQHVREEAEPSKKSRHGETFEIHATLIGPSGRVANVASVWIVRAGEDFPRFVTAYPGEP